MKQYVIIGNGTACVGCIEGIRSVDTEAKITVVSEEKHPVYGRPLISYYLEGKTTLDKMNYRPADFYEKNGCEVLYGVKAEEILPAKDASNGIAGSVKLSDGSVLEYTDLLTATGSNPFVPPFKGLDTVEKKFSFMTLDDALSLEEALTKESRVFIVGAGLIGLKCMEGIFDRVKDVTVCDLADRVLPSILDHDCAAIVQKHLEAKGVTFMLGDSVAEFNGTSATMQSGAVVSYDVLVLAVGVRPNTALIKNAGGSVNRGILVDSMMKTDLPSVYAAGDCTEGFDASLGANRILAILPNAYRQGFCAGVNMAGGHEELTNLIPMNSIGFFGFHMMTAGSYFTEAEGGEMFEEKTEGGLRRLFTKDGLLTGFILLGHTERTGIYTSLIRDKVPLETLNFEMLKHIATSAAFSKEVRSEKFGGAQ